MKKIVRYTTGVALALSICFSMASSAEDNWPRFRGPRGTGVAEGGSPPTRWSETANVAWVTEIEGYGWSSPILWEDRVFVTTAINTSGSFKTPSTGIYGNDYIAELVAEGLSEEEVLSRLVSRDIELSSESESVRYLVYALSAKTGEILWEREVDRGKPFGGRHRKNTFASETPVTDGERIYAYFGNVGLFCLDMDGKLVWERHWEPQPIYLDFGTASSPALHGGVLYIQHDNQEASFLAAVDAKTGEELWRVPRGDGTGMIRSGWSSPFVWENSKRTEIVAIGMGLAIGYATDGRELWRLSGLSGQATPTPLAGSELLYVGTGSQGESNRPMFALRPGASGDISLERGERANEFVAWYEPRASAYTSSPLLYRDRLYVVNDNGILSVFDAATGSRIYRARVGGGGFTFSSSPWAYGGYVFFLGEDGDTFVVKAGDDYLEVGKNSLGEMSLASPAVAGDSLYLRTRTKLYCIRDSHEGGPSL